MIKKRIRRIVGSVYGNLLWVYNRMTAHDIMVSIADLMYPRKCDNLRMDYTQFTTITRIMDVEAYKKGDDSFRYQAALERMISGSENYDYHRDRKRFATLIDSIENHGYDTTFKCNVDMEGYISDGTHRIAVAWYNDMKIMPCRLIKRHVKRKMDWFNIHSDDACLFEEASRRFEQFQNDMSDAGWAFACKVNKNASMVSCYLKTLCHVIKSRNLSNHENGGSIFLFYIADPQFKIENGKMVSETAIRIKKIMTAFAIRHGLKIEVSLNCEEGHRMWEKSTKDIAADES